jgi:anti-sigma-K factor RskA
MNVKEYISSGIVESYVMGLASEAERQEFETNCVQYPEIAEARNVFELALEQQLLKESPAAPLLLKNQVFDKITSSVSETNTSELEQEHTPVRSLSIWRWLAVASLVLLAGSVYWAITSNNMYQEMRARNANLLDSLKKANDEIATINGTGAAQPKSDFKMASITAGSDASVSIYWDTTSKDVYLMIKNMPEPPTDKQYQLWALLPQEGAPPIDLGMIELKQQRLLYRMKNVQNAKAFAITLEPKGGSPSPTSQPMVSSQPINL